MTYRLIVRIEAEVDITDAAIRYQNQRSGLGEEFISEVDAAMEGIVANPRQYPRVRRRPEVRRVLTRRFPYRIFFILRPDAVVVFRVLHAARHDREWRKSVPTD
jgi:plasmid stabilization system protein ParE